ncbi:MULTISPECIES: nuclear transport factor 2 family protein [unclassified Crossiella]|uniref:nuclear transport factor 2 family protein n=1 Tax=unclassified Crossiella TaxID=2620835 RepID=UPI001FFF5843|nr:MULTISPECIES: nuclear transport factor 2 family protein [unclassified Crossiella]MCK2241334.1 nuclear transport factor 2 family protein [Crossiella sp. S99.2]MCK2253522.1 nuclear transport factor 2 family protein [Crossiella sp. S99.1]
MAEVDAERYVEVLRFYARQMALLDRLDLDGYLGTFTEDGVTHHVHHGKKLEGRAEMRAFAEAALPRYRENVPRHWNDHYEIEQDADGDLTVGYCSLVTLTDKEGKVRFESTFAVTDELVRRDGRLLVRSRTLVRDRPAAA